MNLYIFFAISILFILLAYALYLLHDIAISKRIEAHSIQQHYFDLWLDAATEKTVRIVEEGGLDTEFKDPVTSEEKQKLATNILQDAVSFAGHDVKQFHFPALIKSKVNELYHGELK